MASNGTLYHVAEIPDISFPRYQEIAGGAVAAAIWNGAEHLARVVADMPAGSMSLVIRFVYSPDADVDHPQKRLSIYLGGWTRDDRLEKSLTALIRSGPLAKYYEDLREARPGIPHAGLLKSVCHVFRRDHVIGAHTPHNPEGLDRYYLCLPFKANDRNDYLTLDSVLHGITEHVVIDLAFEPADITEDARAHARYVARLRAIDSGFWEGHSESPLNLLAQKAPHRQDPIEVRPLKQRDLVAEDVCRQQERLQEKMPLPHLRFHLAVLAETEATAHLVGSVIAESGFMDGTYQTAVYADRTGVSDLLERLRGLRVSDHRAHPSLVRHSDRAAIPALSRLPHIATVDEILGVLRLPIARSGSPFCIRKNTDPMCENAADLIPFGLDTAFLPSDGAPTRWTVARGVSPTVLTRHLFTCGMSGTGKTCSNVNLLLNLHRRGIPFLAIESAKREYRALKLPLNHKGDDTRDLATALEFYTPGNDSLSPLRFNPLQLLPGISAHEHIDAMHSCFVAAMPLGGVLPALLAQAMDRVYADRKAGAPPPRMLDLVLAAKKAIESKGYSAETTSDLRAALDARLGTLTQRTMGTVFQCEKSVPDIPQMLSRSTVIEMDRLQDEQACLLILFLLTAILESLKSMPPSPGALRYVIVIEEAHKVIGRNAQTSPSEDYADPKAMASQLVIRMLAELRAMGVGLVISDQLPSAVAPEVVKHAGTKLSMRQVDKANREELGAAMLWSSVESEEVARLRNREAFLFTEGYYDSRKILTADIRETFSLATLSDAELRSRICNEAWFRDARSCRRSMELNRLSAAIDRWKGKLGQVAMRTQALEKDIAGGAAGQQDAGRCQEQARKLRKDVADVMTAITKGFARRYWEEDDSWAGTDDPLFSRRNALETVFKENVSEKGKQLAAVLDKVIDAIA